MEIRCPKCGQRLNVRDGLRNPSCRCPSCQEVFRAADYGYRAGFTAESPQPDAAASRAHGSPVAPAAELPVPGSPAPGPADPEGGGPVPRKFKIGTILFIALIALKILSRLVRHADLPVKQPNRPARNAVSITVLRSQYERPQLALLDYSWSIHSSTAAVTDEKAS